jgi:ribosome maturation factor RimP
MANDLGELERALTPLLAGSDVELVDIELRSGTLTVTVSRSDGLDLESLTGTARAVSDFLDAHDEMTPDEPYELEVTSPGLERRLRRPTHFERVIGQVIAVRTTGSTPGERRFEGELVAADEKSITVRVDGATEPRIVDYGSIDRAHTVFDWKAALASDKRQRRDVQHGGEPGRDSARSEAEPRPRPTTRKRETLS